MYDISDNIITHLILSSASLFVLSRSYESLLIAEISQLCYGGIARLISFGSTDGICVASCLFIMTRQPVVISVGRLVLGRILNVLGGGMDPYLDVSVSGHHHRYHILLSSVNKYLLIGSFDCEANSYGYHISSLGLLEQQVISLC